jgi:DNA polymerase III delta prime subunit
MQQIKIKSIKKLEEKRHVYDLSVEGNHNFFIGNSETLTHNCDYLTPNAQAILRNLMETFSKHCRFILTCNYIEKIIDPIQSRCQSFAIMPPNKKDVAIHLTGILAKENIKYDVENVANIINSHYPDIRKIINTVQLHSAKGELRLDRTVMIETNFQSNLIDILKSDDNKRNIFLKVRQLVADNKLHDYSDIYTLLYDRVDEYAAGNVSNVILILSDHVSKDSLVVDKEIVFAACMIQIINTIKQ